MDQTIILDKHFEQRLEEYFNIFSENEISSIAEIKNVWSSYLETIIDPFGWQAIWKIPYFQCEEFKIIYPSVALVYVDAVYFQNLTASIKILSVEHDVKLANEHIVELIYLWPTEEQDKTLCLNLDEISDALDKLRFFYKHIWRPWDSQEDYQFDWKKRHLEARLRLYYDLQNSIPKNIACYYRFHLIEAKEKFLKIEQLQNEIDDDETDITGDNVKTENQSKIDLLYALHADLTTFKSKLAVFEIPLLRLKRLRLDKMQSEMNSEKLNVWLIFDSDKQWDDYMNFMVNVKKYCVNVDLMCNTSNTLQQAFELTASGDQIYVGSGTHIITGAGNFPTGGGSITNVDYPKEAIIESLNLHTLLEITNTSTIILENLILSLNLVRYGIKIKPGCNVKMLNCTITGNITNDEIHEKSSIQRGITIQNAKLELNNCKFETIATAISLAGPEAILFMINCSFVNCNTAVRIENMKQIEINTCKFINCDKCVINLIVENMEHQNDTHHNISIFDKKANINIIDSKIESPEGVSDVLITSKKIFKPMQDVLSNPVFNKTL